jgi:short-subunit dehydrogenase
MHLAGSRVLVTGASRGIGEALARALARRGAHLALVARSAEPLEQLAEAVGGRAYPADLTDLDAIPGLVERIEADGGIDVLINNAGVSNIGWFPDADWAALDQVVTLDLRAPMRLCHTLIPRMLERGHGHIVNISSMAGVFATPGLAAYGASKAGLTHLTHGLRADLRDDPIVLTTVHLGSVRTDMDDAARGYPPIRYLVERSKGRDITPMEDFVAAVIDGIERDRPEVRLPRAAAPLVAAANLPRRIGRLLFKRAPAKPTEHATRPTTP